MLAINAVLGTLGTPLIVRRIIGRSRRSLLLGSQGVMAAGFAVVLAVAFVPTPAALALAVVAVVLVTGCEVMQGAVVPASVSEASTRRTLGRLSVRLSAHLRDLRHHHSEPGHPHLAARSRGLWLPLIAIALLDMPVLAAVARRLRPLRVPVGTTEANLTQQRIVVESDFG